VRAPAEPGEAECRAALGLVLAAAGALAVPALVATPAATHPAVGLCVAGALVVGAFSVVPAALLERRFAFAAVARIEAAQALAYNAVAVALAWAGQGVASVAAALLVRAAVGALGVHRAQPGPLLPCWDPRRVGPHLRFGLPALGATVVSQAKDAALPVLVGAAAGAAAVGLVSFAQLAAAAPSLALTILSRLYLPAFARLQADPAALARAASLALRGGHAVVAPLAVLALALAEPGTRLLFGPEWLPALPTFRLLWVANLFAPTALVVLGLFGARGRSRAALAVAAGWAAGTWLLGAPLVAAWGAVGYGVANVAVHGVTLAAIRTVRRDVPLRPLAEALPAWLAAGVAGGVVWHLSAVAPVEDVAGLVLLAVLGLVLHGAAVVLLRPAAGRRVPALVRQGA
jgi:PST family polysaccharide transporter